MIIVKPLAGLCNRMRVINSCISLQNRNSNAGEIQMIWEKNELLNCDFSDIFQPIKNIKIIRSHPALTHFLHYHNNRTLPLKSRIKKNILYYSLLNYKLYDNDIILPFRFQEEYWDTAKHNFVINTYSEFYDSQKFNNYQAFKPVDQLQSLINSQVKKFTKTTIGVHIRRTDNIESIKKSTTKLFINALADILEKDSNQLFYLATDDLEVENLLRKRFEKYIITQENKDFRRGTKKGIQDALVDLYTLSRTKKIIGSYYSSFSWTASFLNRIPMQIIE
ncbi:hypothetical protein FW778_19370 [Ginsengibacter hankyongi]|uniref:Glycosyl transferase family 11 n=1 Tax=Ginsengibacter hankyongi TaxID=2607284 RepID=A0A5J5IE98_9BACT|nr:hypothetical protein [Ginsengibacter hankyongi]KAA9036389.1 hypothetical protein FW778_19370 [Ginsengibacter hankyongi]